MAEETSKEDKDVNTGAPDQGDADQTIDGQDAGAEPATDGPDAQTDAPEEAPKPKPSIYGQKITKAILKEPPPPGKSASRGFSFGLGSGGFFNGTLNPAKWNWGGLPFRSLFAEEVIERAPSRQEPFLGSNADEPEIAPELGGQAPEPDLDAEQALAQHQKFVADVHENGIPESQYKIIEKLAQATAEAQNVPLEDLIGVQVMNDAERGPFVRVAYKNPDDAQNPMTGDMLAQEFLGVEPEKLTPSALLELATLTNMYLAGDLKNSTAQSMKQVVTPQDGMDSIATLSNFPREMAQELNIEIPEADDGKWKDLTGSGHVYIRGAAASLLRIHNGAHDADAVDAAKGALIFAQKKPEIFIGQNVGQFAALGSRILDAEKNNADLKAATSPEELDFVAKEIDAFAQKLRRDAEVEGAPEYLQKYAHEVGVANAHFQHVAKTELKAALEAKAAPTFDDAKAAVGIINDFPKEMASSLGIQVSQDENEAWRDFTGTGHVYVRGTWASLERIHNGEHDAAAAEAALGTLKYAQKAPEKFFGDNADKVAALGERILNVEKQGGSVADAVSAEEIEFLRAELQNFHSIIMNKASAPDAGSYAVPYAALTNTVAAHYQNFGNELKAEMAAKAEAAVKPEDKPKAEKFAANLLDRTGIHIGDVTGVEAVEMKDGTMAMEVHLNDSAALEAGKSSRIFRISTGDVEERSKLLNALATGEFEPELPTISKTMFSASKVLDNHALSIDDVEYARVYGDKIKLKVPGEDELRDIKIPEGAAAFASVFEVANAINELKTRQEAMKARHPGSLHNEAEQGRLQRENERNDRILSAFEGKVEAAKFAQIDDIDGEAVVHLYNGKDDRGITMGETIRVPFATGATARINDTLDGIRSKFDKSPTSVDMDVVLGLAPSNDVADGAATPKIDHIEKLTAKLAQIDPNKVDSVRIPDDPAKGVQQIVITYAEDVDPKAEKLPMRITVPYGLADAAQIEEALDQFKYRMSGYDEADADLGRQCLLAITGNHIENVESVELEGDNVLIVKKDGHPIRYNVYLDRLDTDMSIEEITAHIQHAIENDDKQGRDLEGPEALQA